MAGRFKVLLADVPWGYDQYRDTANGAAKAAMETACYEDLASVPVATTFAADDCLLMLWATGPKMPEATDLVRTWGFEWKTMAPWLKVCPSKEDMGRAIYGEFDGAISRGGIGIWVESKVEYVTFSVRGNVGGFYTVAPTGETKMRKGKEVPKMQFTRLRPRPVGVLVGPRDYPVFYDPDISEDPDYWNGLMTPVLLAEAARKIRGENNHSKKPLALYDYAETFPGPYMDMYARAEPIASFPPERRKKWLAVGLETGWRISGYGARRL